jgi:hypothetical protein
VRICSRHTTHTTKKKRRCTTTPRDKKLPLPALNASNQQNI